MYESQHTKIQMEDHSTHLLRCIVSPFRLCHSNHQVINTTTPHDDSYYHHLFVMVGKWPIRTNSNQQTFVLCSTAFCFSSFCFVLWQSKWTPFYFHLNISSSQKYYSFVSLVYVHVHENNWVSKILTQNDTPKSEF